MLDLDAATKIEVYVLVWAGLLLLALTRFGRTRHGSVGLPLALLASYTSAHAGAIVHLVSGYDHNMSVYLRGWGYSRQTVADGLEASCLAMLAATLGFAVVDATIKFRKSAAQLFQIEWLRKGSILLMLIGLGDFAVGTALGRMGIVVPGLQATQSTIQNLFVVGVCVFVLHRYLTDGQYKALILSGVLALTVPAILLVTTAILADSIVLAMVVMTFYLALPSPGANTFRRNLTVLGLSTAFAVIFAVFYLQAREALRDVVWGGGGIGQAIEDVVSSAERFNVRTVVNTDSLLLLDARLNQNIFVGLAIEQLHSMPDTYENGATIELALFAWVPRFLWADKPTRGGSKFLAKHTGLEFSEGTTFGAGPIYEFYVNYGYFGVFFGFLALGALVRRLDVAAYRALATADLARFAQYHLAGISLLSPLADVFFLVTALVTALLVGWGLRFVWKQPARRPKSFHRTQARL